MKIMLKLENMNTGEPSFEEFADEESTIAWLRERPRFTDVLGVVFEGLTREQNERLKATMRPLDDEERAAEKALVNKREQEAEALRAVRAREDEVAQAAHRAAQKDLNPNRTMEVRYRYDTGLSLTDRDDPREISEEVRAVVLAWVAERNEWVDSRGQIVGEAKVTVYPNALPKPGADRILHGSFVPVTGPKKD
jgi:tRNA(Ser,Leu) C12 N-acetylase TAN1